MVVDHPIGLATAAIHQSIIGGVDPTYQ